ncbi:MAG TPA: hypothetical protein PKW15_00165 [Alphaproteobacteria bacterium]|nr:hypothetical protein [Alphaproteobacteria bacterium]
MNAAFSIVRRLSPLALGALIFSTTNAEPANADLVNNAGNVAIQSSQDATVKVSNGQEFKYNDNVTFDAKTAATPNLTPLQKQRVEKILGSTTVAANLAKEFGTDKPSVVDVITHALGIVPRSQNQTNLLPEHCESERLRIEGPRTDGTIYWRGGLGYRTAYFAESDVYQGNASKNNKYAMKIFNDTNGVECRRFRLYYTLEGEESDVAAEDARRNMWECDFEKFWGVGKYEGNAFITKLLKAYETGDLKTVPAMIRDVMNVQEGQTDLIRGYRTYFSGFSWDSIAKANDVNNINNPNSDQTFIRNPAGEGSGRGEQIDGINGKLAGIYNRAYHNFDRYRPGGTLSMNSQSLLTHAGRRGNLGL